MAGKKFRFSLESVLKLRRYETERARQRLERTAHERQQQEEQVQHTQQQVMRLVGTVGERWAQLTDPERQQLVRELGGRVEAFGIGDLILVDHRSNIQGRYGDGGILWLARSPRGAGSDD